MTTLHNAVKTYLLANAGVVASPCSTRIYVDAWLPLGYQITDGPILIITPRGGPGSNVYKMENQTMVFRSFSKVMSEAFAIDEAVFMAFLQTGNPANATSIYAKDTVSPVLSRVEDRGLYVVTSSFGVSRVIS